VHPSVTFILLVVWRTDDPWVFLAVFAAFVLGQGAIALWKYLARKAKENRAEAWPAVSAVIDIAVVDKQWQPGSRSSPGYYYYLVMLTYAYHNPDLQTGDYTYTRRFKLEDDARDLANACKGRTVTVHVDPKDPSHSVLRKEDLDNAVSAAPEQKLTTSN
jgi:hypothetical protein